MKKYIILNTKYKRDSSKMCVKYAEIGIETRKKVPRGRLVLVRSENLIITIEE
jgi:hypothetical protein